MPSDLISNTSTKQGAILTQHGQGYGLIGHPHEPPKKPAGTYICMECGDAQITFHTPQDEFKTKCPKCNSLMTRVNKPLSVA